MEKQEVPQDENRAYVGWFKRALYAIDERGQYGVAESTGWAAEEIVNDQAAQAYAQNASTAAQRVRAGLASPLEYHMYDRRMDLATLAQATGLWRFRVRRHLRPEVFARLKPILLERYAQALNLDPADLTRLPEPGPD